MEWSERRGRRGKGRERGGKREGEGRRGGEEEERREREGGRGGEEEKRGKRKGKEVPILHSQYVCLSCFNSHCSTRA